MEHSTSSDWVLYDDSCGLCRTWVPRWQATLYKAGFSIAPLQSAWVKERIKLPEQQLTTHIRVLLDSGEQIEGADAYRVIFKRIWWAFPVWLLSVLPVTRQIFNWSYAIFAKNRNKVSKMCGL